MTIRLLTGITPSGTPHLGNYVGCIRPSVADSKKPDTESFYFLSDLHALIKVHDPERIEKSRLEIAATWLACGLDPEVVHFYRQSDLPEVPELNWMLNCVSPKGLMNRAHAYKAKVDANANAGEDLDVGISMGLYCYPILMAADILIFNANYVPVGKDQVQHIEMCRDIATRFNQTYGKDIFTLPEPLIDEEMAVLPGLDGRKMSKSYDNVIPLFEGGAKALKEAIAKIVTDSKLPGEPKDPDSTALTQIFDAFATPEERAGFRDQLKLGMGWGIAKEIVYEKINKELSPMRRKYEELMGEPEKVENILAEGAARVRPLADALIKECRDAVGLKRYVPVAKAKPEKVKKKTKPSFKQYKEGDGLFWFKLNDADGNLVLTGGGVASGQEAGKAIGKFKTEGMKAFDGMTLQLEPGITEEIIEEIRTQMVD
ncbi:MAG: tryptophan--tRNA ligase [Burkholderiales bacterium]|nr:tryptophan--tRNA ligase [Burkholderiales bacterium]